MILVCVGLPMAGADRDRSIRATDASQISQIHLALSTWAGTHQGSFPLPSAVDLANRTVFASTIAQRTNDNTGNIFSFLIFNGLPTPVMMVASVEVNASICADIGYQYSNRMRAAVPAAKPWDPSFAVTPIDSGPGASNRRQICTGASSYAQARVGLSAIGASNAGLLPLASLGDRGFLDFDPGTCANGAELWFVDLSGSSPRRAGATSADAAFNPLDAIATPDGVSFAASRESVGTELFRADHCGRNTTLVADINPGPAGSSPEELTRNRHELFFRAIGPTGRQELWALDLPLNPECAEDFNADGKLNTDDAGVVINACFDADGVGDGRV